MNIRTVTNLFVGAFITMVLIYIIKMAANKYNIPVIKTVAEGV